jgi:hypothetical protein
MTVIIARSICSAGEGTVGYLHASWAVGALLAGGAPERALPPAAT